MNSMQSDIPEQAKISDPVLEGGSIAWSG